VSELEIVALPNGQLVQNCYLIADAAAREAVIVDPGEEPGMFLAELDTRGWTLAGIWLTHAHVDHIMGVGAVKRAHDVPVYLHAAERALYDALPQQGEWMGLRLEAPPAPEVELKAGGRVRVGRHEFEVRHTPGHSPGSVSFVGGGVILGGDVLFNGSVGRTDLPGGDAAALMQSIQHHFLSLPDSTVVHSGHGPETTIGVERLTNPFLTGAYRLE
jgi:glyoxylase-like metal-dependent hydrolase (beta-lactamase superfamily II)